jgi:hypothetical protein
MDTKQLCQCTSAGNQSAPLSGEQYEQYQELVMLGQRKGGDDVLSWSGGCPGISRSLVISQKATGTMAESLGVALLHSARKHAITRVKRSHVGVPRMPCRAEGRNGQ